MAAERRNRDNLWCSSCGEAGAQDGQGGPSHQAPASRAVCSHSAPQALSRGEGGRDSRAASGQPRGTTAGSSAAASRAQVTASTGESLLSVAAGWSTQKSHPADSAGGGGGATAADVIDLTGELSPAIKLRGKEPVGGRGPTVIDLTAGDGNLDSGCGGCTSDRTSQISNTSKKPRKVGTDGSAESQGWWPCGTCTLNNPELSCCSACGADRSGETGGARGSRQLPPARRLWECPACSSRNVPEDSHCSVCRSWRFTRGPPSGTAPLPQMSGLT